MRQWQQYYSIYHHVFTSSFSNVVTRTLLSLQGRKWGLDGTRRDRQNKSFSMLLKLLIGWEHLWHWCQSVTPSSPIYFLRPSSQSIYLDLSILPRSRNISRISSSREIIWFQFRPCTITMYDLICVTLR